jgi:hypothetical protein
MEIAIEKRFASGLSAWLAPQNSAPKAASPAKFPPYSATVVTTR